ncbi:MAG: peptidylprolyl isomerase [Roseburia sp.]|nr:peptidylprolyl isomerase [Roseburia sp.]
MKRMKYILRVAKRLLLTGLLAAAIFGISACNREEGGTRVIFTSGPGKDEVFRIGDEVCNVPELMIYLTTTQNQYESVYGEEIWNTSLNGVTLEENVKETVLEKAAQIKTMYLLAKDKGITLDAAEEEKISQAAGEYMQGLSEKEQELLQADRELIEKLYREYAMANKVYKEIIRDINPEISDDEARTITVQHILFRTYSRDGSGVRVAFEGDAKQAVYKKALQIRELAVDGEHDFSELASRYSEDTVITYSFGKGEMDEAFEEAAFMLETDEISPVIESESGYHIIKCLNTFNREETDTNKLKIVEERRNEAFGREYDEFVKNLARRLNDEVWDGITLFRDKEVTTQNFFTIYDQYFRTNTL